MFITNFYSYSFIILLILPNKFFILKYFLTSWKHSEFCLDMLQNNEVSKCLVDIRGDIGMTAAYSINF